MIFDADAFCAAAEEFRESKAFVELFGLEMFYDKVSWTKDEFGFTAVLRVEDRDGFWAERKYNTMAPRARLILQIKKDAHYLKRAFNTVKAMIKAGVQI